MPKAFDMILAEPWAIMPEGLEQILAIASRQGEDLEALAARLGRPLDNTQSVQMRDDVAILSVHGPVMRYANLFTQISGATSLEILARDFTAALDNPAVSRIVLDIDSPGGQANGISEFAAMVRAADKPVTAYVGGVSASAAYWITAAANQVVISDTAALGSIGMVGTFRPDKSGAVKIISSQSPLKQATPDTETGRSELQRVIDDLAAVFIGAVAGYRGVSSETVLSQFGRGGLLVGAKAVAAGMADGLGNLERVITPNNPARTNTRQSHAGVTQVNTDQFEAHIVASGLDAFSVDQAVEKQWAQSRELRDEFGRIEVAQAYFRAVSTGRLRHAPRTVRG